MISSLYTSLSGLNAQRAVMDLAGHNISNAATPGYHRQRAELQAVGGSTPGIFSGQGTRNFGVNVVGVSRSYDSLLAGRAQREEGNRSSATLTSSTLDQLESVMPEPSEHGLASQLDAFWGAWSDVANNPDGLAVRTQLLATADALATSLHRTSADITALGDTAVTKMATLAGDANGMAAEIATLNKAILSNPNGTLDLQDRRDVVITSLAKLTGGVARPGQNNMIDVVVGGRSIVSGTQSFALDGAGGTLRWAVDNQPVAVSSGEAAALRATITDIVPRYLTALDDVAATLVSSVNALHTVGYDQGGTTGRQFFDPTAVTAATITLSTDVLGQPANIAAGAPVLPGPTAPGALDGDQARAIAVLAESASGADSKYHALISGLAVETRVASRRADLQDSVSDTANQQADSVGSVSLDEEMANLTAAQRAYEASARVMTAVDDMLGFLIERTGMVGR
jgi:flagellar hook-associated protein 1 FlgK